MEPVATVAAVLSIISAIFGIINGGPDACRQAGELLSNNGNTKGEKKLNKIMTCLVWVQQKLQEEVKRRTDSNCSETSIRADLKPLDGEIAEAWSLISDWGNKNCLGKCWAAKEFKKKLEKSEEAIYQRFREFSFYTERYEATQHTNQAAKPATQHIDEAAKSIHLERLTDCTLNLNQGPITIQPITIQPCNEHPHPSRIMKENYGHLMEKKNQNQLRMEKENVMHPSPMQKKNQNQLRMEKENVVHPSLMKKTNQSPMERGKVHRPTRPGKVDKVHNRKPAPGKQGKPAPGKQGIR